MGASAPFRRGEPGLLLGCAPRRLVDGTMCKAFEWLERWIQAHISGVETKCNMSQSINASPTCYGYRRPATSQDLKGLLCSKPGH